MLTSDISLQKLSQPITKNHLRFLRDLYCVCRDYEISQVDWPAKQIKKFLYQQFELQQKDYSKRLQNGTKLLVSYQQKLVGRLYFYQADESFLHLVDVTLLREFRGMGIGRYLLEYVIQQAKGLGLGVSLYVDKLNPAVAFYRSLGFYEVNQVEHRILMQRPINP